MEVYQDYCNKCSEGYLNIGNHFEQIPCKILMLCYDKDCKDFRSAHVHLYNSLNQNQTFIILDANFYLCSAGLKTWSTFLLRICFQFICRLRIELGIGSISFLFSLLFM